MGSDGALLEQHLAVLQEAHDRAEEIRNEIATLKEKTGASNAVTVPQLLKGDAIPDVTEPEGKPDDPESSLQYHASTPSGERQAPPKTEDGTDTEEQQECRRDLKSQSAAASEPLWADSATATTYTDSNCNTNTDVVAADTSEAGSWQGVYRNVLHKLSQSRSSRQHLSPGTDIASMLHDSSLPGSPSKLSQRGTPFAGDVSQAAAVTAGAITSENCTGGAQDLGGVIEPSPVHVIEGPYASNSKLVNRATYQGDHAEHGAGQSGSKSSSSGGSSGAPLSDACGSSTNTGECEAFRGPQEHTRLPMVVPSSAADLPVQAVLEELDQLLAWQTARSPATAAQQQAKAKANIPPESAGGRSAANYGSAEHEQHSQEQDEAEEDMVSKWVRATQQQRGSVSRRNSDSGLLSDVVCDRSGCSSSCSSMKGGMRRSNSMPSHNEADGTFLPEADSTDKTSKIRHSSKQGSADLRDEIISHLKMAAAFRSQSRSGSQHAAGPRASASASAAAAVDAGQVQHGVSLVDWASIDRYLDGASTPSAAAAGSNRGSQKPSSCQSTPTSGSQHTPGSDPLTPSGLRNIRTNRAGSAAAEPAIGSPLAAINSPQRSQSPKLPATRSAQLYHKLLQGSLHGSSSSTPKAMSASSPTRQPHSSPPTAEADRQHSGGRFGKASALGKKPSATGSPVHPASQLLPDRHHKHATAGSSELTCSTCGSPVVTSTFVTPFSAAAAQHSNLSPHRAEAVKVGMSADVVLAAAAGKEAKRAASPGGAGVAFASLSLSTLLADETVNNSRSQADSPAGKVAPTDGVNSFLGTPDRALAASYNSYSSKAASRKALVGSTAGSNTQGTLSKQAAAAAAAPSPPRKVAAATKAASPSRAGYASSAGKQVSRVKAAAAVKGSVGGAAKATSPSAASPAAGDSSLGAAMVTVISCGQLLQEAALHQAFRRVSCGAEGSQDAASAPQQLHLELHSLTAEDSNQPASHPARRYSRGAQQDNEGNSTSRLSSSGGSSQLQDVFVYRLQATNDAAGSSPAAAAAAAALQTLAAGAGRRGASVSPGRSASPKPTNLTKHSRSNSAGPPCRPSASPGVSRSSSARSKASVSSNTSGSSQRVWRPGGQRTSAKDDCKKLQAYESARRALIGAGGDSAGKSPAPAEARIRNAPATAPAPAAAVKRPQSPDGQAAGDPARPAAGRLGKAGSPRKVVSTTPTTRAPKVGPAAMAAAARAKASPTAPAKQPQQPTVTEQGVQADLFLSGLISASTLLNELKCKSQPNSRQTSPGRMQQSKPALEAASTAPAPLYPILQQKVAAASISPAGESSPTTSQVEEAIKAAQVALLQRRWQISQLRKAMQQHGITPAGSASSNSPASTVGGCRITAGSRAAAASVKRSEHEGLHAPQLSSSLANATELAAVPGLALSVSCTGPNAEGELHQDAPLSAEGSYASQASAMAALIRQRHSTGGAGLDAQAELAAVGPAVRVSANSQSLHSSLIQRRSTGSSPFAAEGYIGTSGVRVASPAWSAPQRVSSSGKTADELIKYYRRSSAAETAEAAAVAAAEGAAEGSLVPGSMNLDAMLRAYNALSRRKNSVDKSAALAALMANIVAVAGVQALEQVSSVAEEVEQEAATVDAEGSEQQDRMDALNAQASTAVAAPPAAAGEELSDSNPTAPGGAAGVLDDALAAAAAEEGSGLVIVRKADLAKPGAIKLKDTATGKAVLSGIDGSSLTVQQAVHWLKVGLTRIPGTTSGGGAAPGQQRGASSAGGAGAAGLRSGDLGPSSSPKARPRSRPCSPFNCFASADRLSDEDDYAPGHLQERAAAARATRHQQPQDGVQFEMDESNQLVMVVPQQLSAGGPSTAAGVYKYTVTGVSLLGDSCRNSDPDGRFSSSSSSGSLSLELVTCVGRHKIELASERDWAGLLAGLNAMLLLREAQGSKLAKQLENVPISETSWSSAVEGVEV